MSLRVLGRGEFQSRSHQLIQPRDQVAGLEPPVVPAYPRVRAQFPKHGAHCRLAVTLSRLLKNPKTVLQNRTMSGGARAAAPAGRQRYDARATT
jgi:hypothetical protein